MTDKTRYFRRAEGELYLEELPLDLYDTQRISASDIDAEPFEIQFFQDGGSPDKTNVPTYGQLMWPKRFSADSITISASEALASVLPLCLAQLIVGNQPHLGSTVRARSENPFPVETRITFGGGPVEIPSVQHFAVQLTFPEDAVRILHDSSNLEELVLRCSISGRLYRLAEHSG